MTVKTKPVKKVDLRILQSLEKKVLWLSMWMVHNANHLRQSVDGLKVGGHQASSASITTIMTALYFNVLRSRTGWLLNPMQAQSSMRSNICWADRQKTN